MFPYLLRYGLTFFVLALSVPPGACADEFTHNHSSPHHREIHNESDHHEDTDRGNDSHHCVVHCAGCSHVFSTAVSEPAFTPPDERRSGHTVAADLYQNPAQSIPYRPPITTV